MKIFEISQEIRSIMNEKPEPDERELTRRFLRLVSQNHRIKYYQVSQQDEAIIGADWLWLIYTNVGVYGYPFCMPYYRCLLLKFYHIHGKIAILCILSPVYTCIIQKISCANSLFIAA